MSAEPDSPELIDERYEVVRKLGVGGFGHVLLVRDKLHRGKEVALKILHPASGETEGFEERFLHEIEILRSMQHEGIPRIFNDGRAHDGSFYFTMEFVDGPTLASLLRKLGKTGGRMAPDRMVRIMRRVLEILDYAHARGVVHRDLKPGNIMLVRAGQPDEDVRVLDFGIAKVLRGASSGLDLPSLTVMPGLGTPHYISPEQLRGKDIDARADLYAIGVILYQLCSGSFPFGGDSDMEIATARLVEDPKPLDDPATPPAMRKLVHELLERDRDRRPSSSEVRRRLFDAEINQPKIETEAFRQESAADAASPASSVQQPQSQFTPRIVAGALLGLVVVVIGLWAFFFQRGSVEQADAPAKLVKTAALDAPGSQPSLPSVLPAPPSVKPEPKPSANPELPLSVKPEPKPSVKPEPKPDASAELPPSVKSEPKPSVKPEPPLSVKLEPKPSVKPEPKPSGDSEPPVSVRPEPKPSEKPEPKPSVNSEPPPNVKPEPKPATKPFVELPWAVVIESEPNPRVIADKDLRARIQATGLPWRVSEKISKIEMLLVPPGSYTRGASPDDPDAKDDEKPAHTVLITKPFYLGSFEVGVADWARVMNSVPPTNMIGLPVVDVSFEDIAGFLSQINAKGSGTMRLPTEAEWEYACRGGSQAVRYGNIDQIAVYSQNSSKHVAKIGTKQANALGFRDMLGNVWEFCEDRYSGDTYESCKAGVSDPKGPLTGFDRVRRGGAWSYDKEQARASERDSYRPNQKSNFVGFRVAHTP